MDVNMPRINGAACLMLIQRNVMFKDVKGLATCTGNTNVHQKNFFENREVSFADKRIYPVVLSIALKRIVTCNMHQVKTICNTTL